MNGGSEKTVKTVWCNSFRPSKQGYCACERLFEVEKKVEIVIEQLSVSRC